MFTLPHSQTDGAKEVSPKTILGTVGSKLALEHDICHCHLDKWRQPGQLTRMAQGLPTTYILIFQGGETPL